jgi:PKD repeat protein
MRTVVLGAGIAAAMLFSSPALPQPAPSSRPVSGDNLDGGSNQQNPVVTFSTPGVKTVTLTVCNANQQCTTHTQTLTVLPVESESFYTITPCRALDTRLTANPLVVGQPQTASLATCGLPPNARAAALNLTAVIPSADGSLVAWPSDQPIPGTSNLAYRAGAVRATFSVVPLARSGPTLKVAALAGTTDLLIDVTGYFAP